MRNDIYKYIWDCIDGKIDLAGYTFQIVEKRNGAYLYKFQIPPNKRLYHTEIMFKRTHKANRNLGILRRQLQNGFTQGIIKSYSIKPSGIDITWFEDYVPVDRPEFVRLSVSDAPAKQTAMHRKLIKRSEIGIIPAEHRPYQQSIALTNIKKRKETKP